MEKVILHFCSCIEKDEAESLLGKTIERVEAGEYRLILYFTDGTKAEIQGHTYSDQGLSVDLD